MHGRALQRAGDISGGAAEQPEVNGDLGVDGHGGAPE